MPRVVAASLGEIVQRRTNGNPFFVLRYLHYLNRREPQLLYYNERRSQWQASCSLFAAVANIVPNRNFPR
jgi:predicted ATPase